MDLEGLYARLPIRLQSWVVGLEGRRIQRQRYGPGFESLLDQYSERTGWSADRIAEHRDHRLADFISHSARTVPHYREKFRRLGLDPKEIRGLGDLKALPILRRAEVQEDSRSFHSDAIRLTGTIPCHTSGSTGAGLAFPATLEAHREQWAVWWRYRQWHDIGPSTPCLYFGGRTVVPTQQKRPPFWRTNRPGRQVLFSSYHLGPETAPFYLEEMRRSKYPWIHGYPSVVALLAGYLLEAGEKLDMRWVTLGAESVLPQQAERIARAFGRAPIEHYGMAEGVANISMCPGGSMHIDEDFAAMELEPIGNEEFRIVGTNFSNPAFPLIRYDTGDVATVSGRTCGCGRPGRVIDRIDGRIEDYVLTKTGARLGRLDHIFKDLTRVREAQIRQGKAGEMTILVVKGPGYGERDEEALRKETDRRVGDDVDFDIEYVDRIPRTERGKLRFVASTLSRQGRDPAVGEQQEIEGPVGGST